MSFVSRIVRCRCFQPLFVSNAIRCTAFFSSYSEISDGIQQQKKLKDKGKLEQARIERANKKKETRLKQLENWKKREEKIPTKTKQVKNQTKNVDEDDK